MRPVWYGQILWLSNTAGEVSKQQGLLVEGCFFKVLQKNIEIIHVCFGPAVRIIQEGKRSSPIRSDACFPEWKSASKHTSKNLLVISFCILSYISMSRSSTSLSLYTLFPSCIHNLTKSTGDFTHSAEENKTPYKGMMNF